MFSKKTFVSVSLAATLFLAACGNNGQITYKTTDNKELGLTFERPEQWTEQVKPGDGYTDYSLEIPTHGSADRLKGTVGISRIDAQQDKLLKLDDEFATFKNLFKGEADVKYMEEKDTNWLGEKAKEVKVSFKNGEDPSLTEMVIGTVTVHNNKVYVVVFDEEQGDFETYLPVYNHMKESTKEISS